MEYTVNNQENNYKEIEDIEKLIKPFWFNDICELNIDKCFDFLSKYYFENKDVNKIKIDFEKFQRANSNLGIMKFGILIVVYRIGRIRQIYPKPHPILEEKLKVKNVREGSGVMVFSIFTSAYPSYTLINSDGTSQIIHEYKTEQTKDNDFVNRGEFTCKYNCSFCPQDPNMPKSYIATEPGVARAVQNDFDPSKQIFDRAIQYIQQGHPVDKIEVIIQGGTWDSYSIEYRTEFVRDIYWSFNVFMDWIFYVPSKYTDPTKIYFEFKNKKLRSKLSLEQEIKINEKSLCRVIGLTPETRPDQINISTIKFLRIIGATRVQLGVQHLDDSILRYNNRQCYTKNTIRAIKMLKDNGFKVDTHYMLDMPVPINWNKNIIEEDKLMLERINTDPDLKVDQMKIYPCVVTPHTTIKEWYDKGIYKPYGEIKPIDSSIWKQMNEHERLAYRLENPLYKNIIEFYSTIHSSIRVNRIIRDIPTTEICGGTTQTDMRANIDKDLELLKLKSQDIRFREAGSYKFIGKKFGPPELKELVFESSGGTEYFLSWIGENETKSEQILYSFLRLRLSNNSGKTQTGKIIFPELTDCALIRELHTYGKVVPCKENQKFYFNSPILFGFTSQESKPQHKGLGKKLLIRAEQIALANGYKKIAVIAGVGVRDYYRTQGYTINSNIGCYQIKIFNKYNKYHIAKLFGISITTILFISIWYMILTKYNNM